MRDTVIGQPLYPARPSFGFVYKLALGLVAGLAILAVVIASIPKGAVVTQRACQHSSDLGITLCIEGPIGSFKIEPAPPRPAKSYQPPRV